MIEDPNQNGRAVFNSIGSGLEITIPAKKNWFLIFFLTAWLCGWSTGGFFAIREIFSPSIPMGAEVFLIFWVLAWCAGEFFALRVITWMLFGKQVITIDKGLLKIENIFPGFNRKKEYAISSVKKMGIAGDVATINSLGGTRTYNSREFWGMKGGKIKFDYGMNTVKMAIGIDDAEAGFILRKLRENRYMTEANFE